MLASFNTPPRPDVKFHVSRRQGVVGPEEMYDGGLDRSRRRHRVAGWPLSRARTAAGLAHGDVHRHRRLHGLRGHPRRPGRGTPGPPARRGRAARDSPALGPHPEAPRRRADGRVRVARGGAPRRARDATCGAGRAPPHRHPRGRRALARRRSHRPRGERGRAHRRARARRRDPGERRGARCGGRSRGTLPPGAGARDRRPGAAAALPGRGRRLPEGAEGTMYGGAMTVRLAFRPPLDWSGLLGFLAPRATPGVEAVAGGVYRRTIGFGDAAGTIEVRAAAGEPHLVMRGRRARPEALADADLASIGLPRSRAATIRGLARAVARGELVLDASRGLEDAVARLAAVPGIGAWTAHYIAMRALGEPDAFPAADLGLRRALGNGAGPLAPARVAERAEAWRPWRAYAAMHLWTALAAKEVT